MGIFWQSLGVALSVITSASAFPAGASPAAPPNIDDIPLPPGVPRKIKLTDRPNDPAGKLVKIRVGPFTLPPNTMVAALPEEAGGVRVNKPCDECWLGAFQGGLEYEDGSDANIDTGSYMHHYVVVNANKPDWICGLRYGRMSLPQYVYNSGNERPPVRLNNKYKFGMRVDKEDTFRAALELMNMSNETRIVYATTIYEVIPLDTPGYREATHLRMDVWQCGGSDVPAKKGAYKYTMPEYTSQYSGVILHTDGHGHDGTTHVDLLQNGKNICRSDQYYGLRPGAKAPAAIAAAHAADHGAAMQYISDAVACEDEGRVEFGDKLQTVAYYDDNKYPQMTFKGHLEPQMGIHFLYIGRDEATLSRKLKMLPPTEWTLGFPLEIQEDMKKSPPAPRPYVRPNVTIPVHPDLPKNFDIVTNPYVDAPPRPIRFPGFGGRQGLAALLPPGIPASLVPNITLAELGKNKVVADSLTQLLKSYVPGLPADFHLSKVIVPNGIVLSELEPLRDLMFGAAKPAQQPAGQQPGAPSSAAPPMPGGHGHGHGVPPPAAPATAAPAMPPMAGHSHGRRAIMEWSLMGGV